MVHALVLWPPLGNSEHPLSPSCRGWRQPSCLCLFKREKEIKDEGLEDEYDSDDELQYELVLKQRREAIDELAATLETEQSEK